MKKLLFLGACVASLAVSTSAFAAVTYGQNENLTVTANTDASGNVTSVSVDATDFGTTGQKTVLVMKGDHTVTNPPAVEQQNIMYIDQTASGTGIFQNMGLITPIAESENDVYTVMVGNDQGAGILKATFKNEPVVDDYVSLTGLYGDVNGDGSINATDSKALLNALVAGGSNKPGNCTYTLGTKLSVKNSDSILVWGDYNGDTSVNATDSKSLLNALVASGSTKPGSSAYTFGDDFEELGLKVKVVTQ